jgi:antitoxin VapB
MGMNIKNEGVHRRAQNLARLTGESLTQAVDRAVSERLERLRRARNREALAERLLKIGREVGRLPRLDPRSADEMLYDRHGLPK